MSDDPMLAMGVYTTIHYDLNPMSDTDIKAFLNTVVEGEYQYEPGSPKIVFNGVPILGTLTINHYRKTMVYNPNAITPENWLKLAMGVVELGMANEASTDAEEATNVVNLFTAEPEGNA